MFLQQLINGITIGSTYALVAIGYSMVFGVLELINFAHGSVYMLGAYFSLMTYLAMGGRHFLLAFALSMVLSAVVGFSIDRAALRPLRKSNAPKTTALIATLGCSTIIENSVLLSFGTEAKKFPNLLDLGYIELPNARFSYLQLIILGTAISLMIGMSLLVYRTKMGKAMRSTAQNSEAAALMGINVQGVISITFMIGSALAAIAGTLVGMYYESISVTLGFTTSMKTFASAVLGGVGSLPGAMLGGILMGVIETMAASYVSSGYRDAIAFMVLILVLLIKPTGLLGKQRFDKA